MLDGLTHKHSIERIAMESDTASFGLAIEGLKHICRERIEEGARDCEAVFGQADRATTRWRCSERRDFRDRLIAFAQQNTITCFKLR